MTHRVYEIPAFAGMTHWVYEIPAFAGMTHWVYEIPAFAGMTHWVYEIPAIAGMTHRVDEIPAFAGMTHWVDEIPAFAGMTQRAYESPPAKKKPNSRNPSPSGTWHNYPCLQVGPSPVHPVQSGSKFVYAQVTIFHHCLFQSFAGDVLNSVDSFA
jgi:hypothetical protein